MAVRMRDAAAGKAAAGLTAIGPVLPGGVVVIAGAGRRGEQERLCVLVDGPPNADAHRTIEIIEDELHVPDRTVSARLIDAVRSASRRLASDNSRSLSRDRYRLDLALALVRGPEAFVSSCGSLRVYSVRDGQIHPHGADSAGSPLGDEDPPLPIILRVQIAPGDHILLARPNLADFVPLERLGLWIADDPRRAMDWLRSSLGDQVPVVLYEVGGQATGARGRVGADVRERESAFDLRHRGDANLDSKARLGQWPAAMSAREPIPLRRSGDFSVTNRPHGSNWPDPADLPDEPVEHRDPIASAAGVVGPLIAQGFGALTSLIRLFLPHGPARTDVVVEEVVAPRPSRWPAPLPILAGAGSGIAMLVFLAGVFIGSRLGGRPDDELFRAAVADTERALLAATASTDPVFTRFRLRDAEYTIGRALAIRKDDGEANKLNDSVRSGIAKLDRVVRLPGAQPVLDLASAGARSPIAMTVDGGNAYLLDDAGWGVRRVGLEPNKPAEPQLIVAKGAKSDESPVGDPAAIAWLGANEAQNRVGLLALDKDRRLFIQPAGKPLVQLTVRGSGTWGSPVAIRAYAGNLYVLDPKSNQVWRYTPTWNGYDSEMKGLLQNATIPDARDFAVDTDVYVVTGEGRVWRFSGGIGREFDLRSLDKPLDKPSAIVTGPTAQGVYVADTGNSRIVVFDKDGRFQRQIVSDSFAGIRAMSVDEAQSRIVFLANNKLFVAPLPKDGPR